MPSGLGRLRFVAGAVLLLAPCAPHAWAAGLPGPVELAQAAPADSNPPLTDAEKKKLELELLKKKKAGQQPNGQQLQPNGTQPGTQLKGGQQIGTQPSGSQPSGSQTNGTQTNGTPSNGSKLDKHILVPGAGTQPTVPEIKIIKPVTPLVPVPNVKTVPGTGTQPAVPELKIIKPVTPLVPVPNVKTNPTDTSKGTSGVPNAKSLGQPIQPGNTKAILVPAPTAPAVSTTLAPVLHLDDIKKARHEHVDDAGRTVIEEPGNRTIVKQGASIAIQHDDAARLKRLANTQTEQHPGGITATTMVRPDGTKVVSESDDHGHLLRVFRRRNDGGEDSIIDNRRFFQGAAAGAIIGLALGLELAPPVVTIPRDHYIVDYRHASDDDLYEALEAPPLDRLERPYSLEEIRFNETLRDRMRRIDLDNITFRSGASDPDPEQYPKLERLARVLLRVLDRRPNEVFLVEGYTDAVGSEIDNLSLSDRRAESVAQILTESFGVPPENLVTQGYGERFLKIPTSGPERANRRVAVRRITPLMAEAR
jgi:outer membrane protein OmpA-like peptidoglycan-associated protein